MNDREKIREERKDRRLMRFYIRMHSLFGPTIRRMLHYSSDPLPEFPTPFILVQNHTCDYDTPLIGATIPYPMRFIGSEHIYRSPIVRVLLEHFFSPFIRLKGGSDAGLTLRVLRALRRGINICFFPEGNKSVYGMPVPITPATAQLVKASHAALITFRLEGGYFTSPRWNTKIRKGQMHGSVRGIYSPQTLAEMSFEEINELIKQDLYLDSYVMQDERQIPYKGKNLAVGLERILYRCPACGGISTARGQNDHYLCSCGYSVRYTEKGYLESDDSRFRTLKEWGEWQKKRIREDAETSMDETVLLADDHAALYLLKEHKANLLSRGRSTMSRTALTVENVRIPLNEIAGMDCCGAQRLVFSVKDGRHFEFLPDDYHFCSNKYLELYQAVRGITA